MAKRNRVDIEETGGALEINAVSQSTGEEVDTAGLEEAGIAFDPTTMHLQLTKEEKRRTTALMLAIQAYDKLIIKDAEYLREAHSQARSNGSVIRPATMDAMVVAALQFDAFISGRLTVQRSGISRESQSEAPPSDEAEEEPQAADAVDPYVAK
jgi:hypothetical protein